LIKIINTNPMYRPVYDTESLALYPFPVDYKGGCASQRAQLLLMGYLLNFVTALEWSALTPAWALRDFLEDSSAISWFLFSLHTVAIGLMWALLGNSSTRGTAETCSKHSSSVGHELCMLGPLAYAIMAVVVMWAINIWRAHNRLESNDFLALASRSFSLCNFIFLTPLYDKPNLVDKLIRWTVTIAHIIAIPIIAFVAVVAKPWWDTWKCYTVLNVPQGLLDKDYGVCNPPDAVQGSQGAWGPFLITGADPDNPTDGNGYAYTYLDPWRGGLYIAVHIEVFAVALYSIAVFRPQQKDRRDALASLKVAQFIQNITGKT